MKRILILTDFSNSAYNALCYASELFANKTCEFYLLNVYTEKKGFKGKQINAESNTALQKEKSLVRLEKTLQKIKKKYPDTKHNYELISKSSDLVTAIDKLVEKLDIDLMVMGNKGKRSSIPVYLESNATKTSIEVKKCPVLTVPKNTECKPPKKIALATDYRNGFNTQLIYPLSFVAQLYKASVQVLHITTKNKLDDVQKSNLNALKNCLEPYNITFESIPDFISKTKVLQVFLANSDVDMLVMVNNEYDFLEKMLREPIIETMVFKIDTPFLIIPENS